MPTTIRARDALRAYLVRLSPVCLYGMLLAIIATIGAFAPPADVFLSGGVYAGFSDAERHLIGAILILTLIYGVVQPPSTMLWPTVVYSLERIVQTFVAHRPILLVYGAWTGLILLALWDVDRVDGFRVCRRLFPWWFRGGVAR